MYVQRDEDGKILVVYAVMYPGVAEECLEPDSDEITEFYQRA